MEQALAGPSLLAVFIIKLTQGIQATKEKMPEAFQLRPLFLRPFGAVKIRKQNKCN